ncbi:MAG: DUF2283 domain-containing protein [Anaerolineae bacterium]|nr:DUF2283 domain-containing protein [Anaerolineae bacterium]
MRIKYDPSVDILMIYLREGSYAISEEVAPDMIVDLDENGAPLRIEILNARDLFEEGVVKLEVLPVVLKAPA